MKKLLVLLLAVFTLQSCATNSNKNYGDYTNLTNANSAFMAHDTAKRLMQLFPPATTQFSIEQKVNNGYSQVLITDLRHKGYIINEGKADDSAFSSIFGNSLKSDHLEGTTKEFSSSNIANYRQQPAKAAAPTPSEANDISMGYSLRNLGSGLYSLTVDAGDKTLSRAYKISKNKISPAGSWAVKE